MGEEEHESIRDVEIDLWPVGTARSIFFSHRYNFTNSTHEKDRV
jgi:hypothetical protein